MNKNENETCNAITQKCTYILIASHNWHLFCFKRDLILIYEYRANGQLPCFLGTFSLHRVCPSVSSLLPSTQQTYTEFDAGDFYENLSGKSKCG